MPMPGASDPPYFTNLPVPAGSLACTAPGPVVRTLDQPAGTTVRTPAGPLTRWKPGGAVTGRWAGGAVPVAVAVAVPVPVRAAPAGPDGTSESFGRAFDGGTVPVVVGAEVVAS